MNFSNQSITQDSLSHTPVVFLLSAMLPKKIKSPSSRKDTEQNNTSTQQLSKRLKQNGTCDSDQYTPQSSEDFISPRDVFTIENTLEYAPISDDADALCPVCDDHCTCEAKSSSKDYQTGSLYNHSVSSPKIRSLPSSYIVFSSIKNNSRESSVSDPEYCYYYTYSSDKDHSVTSASLSCSDITASEYDSDVMLMTTATLLDEDCLVSELLADGEDPCDKIDGLLYSTESSFEDDVIGTPFICPNHISTEDAGYLEDDEDNVFIQVEEQGDSENSEESSFLLSGFDKNPEKVKKSLYMVDKHLLLEALREMSPDLFFSISNSISQGGHNRSSHSVSTFTPTRTNDLGSHTPNSPTHMISMEEVLYMDYDSDESHGGECDLEEDQKEGTSRVFRWDKIPVGAFRRRMSLGNINDHKNANQASVVTPFKSVISSGDRDPWMTVPKHKRRKQARTYYEQVTTWAPIRPQTLFVKDSYPANKDPSMQSWNRDTSLRNVDVFQKDEKTVIEKEQYNSSSDRETEHDSHGDAQCLRIQMAN